MIIFPDKYTVGFQQRNHDDKTLEKGGNYPLGFFTLDTTLRSWVNWKDPKIQPMEIMNTPRNEFRVYGQTKRDGGWNGSGRSMVYVQHADAFIWEITVENLINILDTCDIVDGEFTDEMVIGKEGKNYVLVPVKSQVYQDHIARLGQPKQKKKATDLVSGDVVLIGKSQWTFIGEFDCVNIETNYDRTKDSFYNYHDITNFVTKKGKITLFMQTVKNKNVFLHKDLSKLKTIELLGNTSINKNKIIIDNDLLIYDQRFNNDYHAPSRIIILDGATNFKFDNSLTNRMNYGHYVYDKINIINIDTLYATGKSISGHNINQSTLPFTNSGISVFQQQYNGHIFETSI